ncbi:hypothetical protein ACWPKO_19560 (plasmid) [Coraliomargarita sp. W4R53]
MSEAMQFCGSRNGGRRCTRELEHRGLHRHRTILWTDAAADEPRCAGSLSWGVPAAPLADGYPNGRALCSVCHRFVELSDGKLLEHDTSNPAESGADYTRRREWLNTHGQ